MGEIKNYTLRLTVLGALFVGSGERIAKSEYIADREAGKIFVMDEHKLLNGLQERRLFTAYTNAVMAAQSGKYSFDLFTFCRDNSIPRNVYSGWAKYAISISRSDDLRKADIYSCVKDPYGLPYIPGSSIKGALRNAVLNAVIMRQRDRFSDIAQQTESETFIKRAAYLKRQSGIVDERAFHTLNKDTDIKRSNAVNSIFKGLRVGDSKPLSLNDIALCRKIDVLPDNSENKLNLYRECIKPKTVVECPVEIDAGIFPYSTDELIKMIREMYEMEDRMFLSKMPEAEPETGTLLYVGGGSGFISKTALYALYSDRNRAVNAAARVLDNVDSKNKGKKVGDHLNDPRKYGVSPHTIKYTRYNGYDYEFGLCRIDFQPMA